jgi:cell shape-determining protein MreD
VLLVLVGLAAQTSLFDSYPLIYIQPDLILLAVIWCGLERDFYEGGILTLIFSYVGELHSSAPKGLFFVVYMTMYFITRLTARLLVIPNRSSLVMMTLAASAITKILGMILLWQLGASSTQWHHFFYYVFPGAASEGIVALGVYRFLERFDWITYKNIRARQLLEDELNLEGEGL